jgi:hypothetical protein
MGILNPNSTNYVHPAEPNLSDLHVAMDYNAAGEPVLRTTVEGITIDGTVVVERVRLWDGTNDLLFDTTVNDNETSPTVVLPTENHNMVFNGSTWDRMRGNIADGVLVKFTNTSIGTTFTNTSIGVTQGTTPWQISKDGSVNSTSNRIFVDVGTPTVTVNQPVAVTDNNTTLSIDDGGGIITVDGTVELGTTTLAALETTTANQGTGGASAWRISANNTDNSSGNPIYVSGNVVIDNDSSEALLVNIGTMPEVEIKNDIDNPIPISKNTTANSSSNPIDVTGSVDATIDGEVSVAGMNPDAFGRQRVSELFTLGDYKHLFAIDPNFLDSVSNGGTVTFDGNQAAAVLATSSNTNSVAIHQTKFYHHYQPGKSQLIYSSVNFRAPHRNVTKRTGYFDDRDGIYFEQVGSNTADGSTVSSTTQTLNWVIRTYVGGSASEVDFVTTINGTPYTYKRRVPQTEWNRDRCDGTGGVNNPSGFKIDITKTQLAWIDFQWLGVGRVRCGFVHNGEMITAHEYYHSNVLPTVYISNPNLPVRCEILNTGTTPGGVFDQICSSVMSEGGYVESGIDWSIYTTARATPTPGQTRFPLVAIRLKNSFQGYPNRLSVRPLSLSLFAKTEPIVYEVVKLPSASSLSTTLNGGTLTWTSADSNSGVEYCVNATGFTSANVDRFASGYVPSGSSQNSLSPVATGSLTAAKKNIISQNITSTDSEVYVIIVSTVFAGNQLTADAACSIQWREIY